MSPHGGTHEVADTATQLVENAEMVAAARFVAEIVSASNALVY
jgi:hypothetical protein